MSLEQMQSNNSATEIATTPISLATTATRAAVETDNLNLAFSNQDLKIAAGFGTSLFVVWIGPQTIILITGALIGIGYSLYPTQLQAIFQRYLERFTREHPALLAGAFLGGLSFGLTLPVLAPIGAFIGGYAGNLVDTAIASTLNQVQSITAPINRLGRFTAAILTAGRNGLSAVQTMLNESNTDPASSPINEPKPLPFTAQSTHHAVLNVELSGHDVNSPESQTALREILNQGLSDLLNGNVASGATRVCPTVTAVTEPQITEGESAERPANVIRLDLTATRAVTGVVQPVTQPALPQVEKRSCNGKMLNGFRAMARKMCGGKRPSDEEDGALAGEDDASTEIVSSPSARARV